MAKFKSVIVAHRAQLNPHVPAAIDILGAFDNMIQPVYPHPMANMSIIVSFEEVYEPSIFEIRLNSPSDELITKGEFTPMVDPFGSAKKILDLEYMLIKERGIYTVDIFQKIGNELKFMVSVPAFMAEYPPQRPFTPELVAEILSMDESKYIRTVKTEFRPLEDQEQFVRIQVSLDPNEKLEEGFVRMPANDKVELNGKTYDLTGVRRQIEWMYGQPIPAEETHIGDAPGDALAEATTENQPS